MKGSIKSDLEPFLDLLDSNYIENFDDFEFSSFMYVCGYGGHLMMNKLSCQLCRDLIIKSIGNMSETDYFDYLQAD